MSTAYTRESKPTTTYTKEPKVGVDKYVFLTWDEATMSWDDATFTWDDGVLIPFTPYTKETKPAAFSGTRESKPTTSFTKSSKPSTSYTKEIKP